MRWRSTQAFASRRTAMPCWEPGAGHRSRGNALTAGDVGYNYVLRALEQRREFAGDLRHELAVRRIRLRLCSPGRYGAARIMAGTARKCTTT